MMDLAVIEADAAGSSPSGWSERKLQDVAQLINGRGFKPFEWDTAGLPIIRIQNLNGSNDFNYYSGRYDPKIKVDPGQLLFAWSGSRGTSFGPHIWNGPKGVLNYHTWKVRVNESEIVPGLFFHVLRHLTRIIEDQAHGASALVHVQKWEMEKFPFQCPDDPKEQEAIAEALSDADALIEGLERLIAKKRLIKQGAMQDLLTAKRRLPGFSGEWQVRKLGALLTVRHGRSQKEVESPSGPYPILATGGQIGNADSYLCNKPSVLIGRKGTIDRPQFVETPFWTVDTLFYTDVHAPNDPRFLFYVFQRIDWQSYNEASGVPSLNAKTIENIEVVTPKADEQAAISGVLKDFDIEIQALEIRLDKARQVKEGMMQNLLTGRIRLV